MNYLPFFKVGLGNIFCLANRPTIALLKTGVTSAVQLQGYWADGRLHPRGEVVTCEENTCTLPPEKSEITLVVNEVNPVDPRRTFWKDGDIVKVGERHDYDVEAFAGLFIYSGMGSGRYYSTTENEILFIDVNGARTRAKAEGVPCVYLGCNCCPFDPKLTRERAEAQELFDRDMAREASDAPNPAQK